MDLPAWRVLFCCKFISSVCSCFCTHDPDCSQFSSIFTISDISQIWRPNQASLFFLVDAPVQDSELMIFKAICPSHFLAPPVINAQFQIKFAEKSVLSSLYNGKPSRPHEINAGAYQARRANLEIAGDALARGAMRTLKLKSPRAPTASNGSV